MVGNADKRFQDIEEYRCQCSLCLRFYDRYKAMIDSGKAVWMTISPPYNDMDPQLCYNGWLSKFLEFRKFTSDVFGVLEMTDDLRIHFHIMYRLKDKIGQYKFVNSVRAMYRPQLQVKIYSGRPEQGIHYLFKDCEDAINYVDDPVFCMETLDGIVEHAKDERRRKVLEKRTEALKEFNKGIPEWMRKGFDSDDEDSAK